MRDKLLSLFGIARRASKLSLGTEASKEAVLKKKACAVFVSCDTAARTEKEFRFISNGEIPVVRLDIDSETVSHSLGKRVSIVTVCDEGFAKTMLELAARLNEGGTTI